MPVIEYKCPNCGSGMAFDAETGALSCPSCGRGDNVETLQDPLMKQTFTGDEAVEYHCTSCGAVILSEAETTATVCSFCGSAVVLGDRLTGKLAPAVVIPFAISKEEAQRAFKKWCRGGRLTPGGFMTADRIKSITGMYVPFWLYELDNNIEVRGTATKVRTYTRGDYRYTETLYYDVYRKIRLDYTKVPVDASEKMNDALMDKLEPFPYQQLKSFKTPYLAGYVAEKYSHDEQELFPRVKARIGSYIESYIRSTMPGYASVSYTQKDIDTRLKHASYALLPVWVVHYDYNRLQYTFAMNGQTGKVVGKPPISKGKVAAWFGGVAGIALIGMKFLSLGMGGGFW
ncbi:TFIIB-type zinc ribbon-containing protein [Paenibacillus sp. IB182496]|uniref:TFIIB-type zinc ribbon-containing protein n=1 Tax=Paenibacillus sabuli TaxID=2772509 RepID=A0A927GR25_9BACL|nr:TFIIB-type zinc ribbon-containing protein [Paenibacillus sabuli]MBD2844876.1 TFIIB-type zinc ribbon-containing protein [Paenibacillus sabuli]